MENNEESNGRKREAYDQMKHPSHNHNGNNISLHIHPDRTGHGYTNLYLLRTLSVDLILTHKCSNRNQALDHFMFYCPDTRLNPYQTITQENNQTYITTHQVTMLENMKQKQRKIGWTGDCGQGLYDRNKRKENYDGPERTAHRNMALGRFVIDYFNMFFHFISEFPTDLL